MNTTQKAQLLDAYFASTAQTQKHLAVLQAWAANLDTDTDIHVKNWGIVGELNYVNELLKQAIEFLRLPEA